MFKLHNFIILSNNHWRLDSLLDFIFKFNKYTCYIKKMFIHMQTKKSKEWKGGSRAMHGCKKKSVLPCNWIIFTNCNNPFWNQLGLFNLWRKKGNIIEKLQVFKKNLLKWIKNIFFFTKCATNTINFFIYKKLLLIYFIAFF